MTKPFRELTSKPRTALPSWSGTSYLKHGLTAEQWLAILNDCGWHCPACGERYSIARPPACDHDHWSGLIRGSLCLPCNVEIGYKHDDATWFANVAAYLQSPPAVAVIGYCYEPGSPGAAGELDG